MKVYHKFELEKTLELFIQSLDDKAQETIRNKRKTNSKKKTKLDEIRN